MTWILEVDDAKTLEHLSITTSISGSSYMNFDTLDAKLARRLTNAYLGHFRTPVALGKIAYRETDGTHDLRPV